MTVGPLHATRAHSRTSPSDANRWVNCPGALNASAGIPDEGSPYADEGTAAHQLAEKCGDTGFNADRFLGGVETVRGNDWPVTQEMVDGVNLYLSTIRGDYRPGDRLYWERRLPLPFLPGEQFGTADATIYREAEKRIAIYDLKYGMRSVEAAGNLQLACYAAGALYAAPGPVAEVEMVIVQPRAYHGGGPVRRWRIATGELLRLMDFLAEAAERTNDPDAPRNAGEWCRYCPARPTCPALQMEALAASQTVFDEKPVAPDALTAEQVGALLDKAEVIGIWLKAIQDHALRLAGRGAEIPGWKLVQKRPTRAWVDADRAREALLALGMTEDEAAPRVVLTPAAAQKALGAKRARDIPADLVEAKSSGVTLAPAGDKRAPVTVDELAAATWAKHLTPIAP